MSQDLHLSTTTKAAVCVGIAAAIGVTGYLYSTTSENRRRSGSLVADPDNHLVEEEALKGQEIYKHDQLNLVEMQHNADEFFQVMDKRRSIRFYSGEKVPLSLVMSAVKTACTAPSGAHLQPWTFVIVENKKVKEEIRHVVEKEEQVNYERRMRRSWVRDVTPMVEALHQNGRVTKPYLSEAPYLIVMMKQTYSVDPSTGMRQDHYYVEQSCGIAAGFLICALHNAGLVTLTSTPMGAESAIRNILGRPANEKVFLLMPVGLPSKDATVPKRTAGNRRRSEHDTIAVV